MWKVLESEQVFSSGLFKLRVDKCELADGRIMPRYYVVEFPDWVNVFPVTEDGKVIMVRQYRHATGKIHLEVPGGSMDPRISESPAEAGRRELLEETGYDCKELVDLGKHFPNPALQPNAIHTFLALGCHKISGQNLDPYEELTVELMTVEELKRALAEGEIDHSLMIASICKALQALA